jgi:nucleoside-diphosphate-sugar epimerase
MSKPVVLITGATGHIGFRTLVFALQAGYRARVSSRKLAQAEALRDAESVKPYLDSIEFVEVPDFLAEGAFDEAVRGVDYVLHLASPIPTPELAVDVKKHILEPAVRGTVSMLQSAAKSPSVKRVVVTSSVVVLATPPGATMAGPYDLCPVPDPDSVPANEWVAYRASKRLAYQAAEDFMASTRPTFDLINIMPSYVQGRNELVTRKEDVHNGSNDVMVDLVLGAKGGRPRFANTVFVDDVARVEVLALDATLAKHGDNFIAAGSPSGKSIAWNDVTEAVRRLFPDAVKSGVLPLGGSQESIPVNYDVSKTEEALGLTFAGLETQTKSLIGQYVELAAAA